MQEPKAVPAAQCVRFAIERLRLARKVWINCIFLCALLLFDSRARAAEPVVEVITQNQNISTDVNSSTIGEIAALPASSPLLISFGAHFGYDDNFTTTPGGAGTWFSDQQVLLSYSRARGPTTLSLLAGGGVVERFGNGTDQNALLDLLFSVHATQRLTLDAKIHAAYQSEPDFSANLGPQQRAGNYFTTSDELSASYQWLPRLSTVSGYSVTLLRYEDSMTAALTDREEHTLSEEFRFELLRDTILVADYRFLAVDYVTAPQDSMTHFILGGVEHAFSSRLQAQARAGVSFRSFDQGGSETDPTFEGSLNYLPGRHSSLSWTMRYGVEEGNTIGLSGQTTFRTGLQFQYAFTQRLSTSLGFYYTHSDQSDSILSPGLQSSSSDAYDFSIGLRFQVSRHVDVDMAYQYTEQSGGNGIQNYSRNRVSAGLNIAF